MNYAKLTSERLDKMYEALWTRPEGATTAQLQKITRSCSVATDISELRKNGLDISCVYVGMKNGRKVYKYKLEE